MFSSIKKIALALTAVSAFSLSACLQGEDASQATPTTHLRVKAEVGSLITSGSVAKGNTISLAKVVVMLVASGSPADTVRDTITPGEQGFVASSANDQTIDSNYSLKALRNWKVYVTVYDNLNFVTHKDSITPAANNFVRIGDTTVVTFGTLAPKFTQYRAVFSSLPDSVTTLATTNKQAVRFTRLVLRIDGVVVKDSLRAGYFNGLPPDTLDYDYVTPGFHTIRLAAYGSLLNAAGTVLITDTLFSGQDTITTVAGLDGTRPITLNWTNPNNNRGNEKITVTIGKVGRTTVTGTTSGTNVVPKGQN
jgi:hypothetical protein